MLGKIFNHLDDDFIEKLAKQLGNTIPKELFFLTFDKMNFENMMQILEINASRFGAVKHTIIDGKHSLNICHDINKNFSHFLALSHQSLSDELSLKLTIQNEDKHLLCFEVSDSN